jgi:hypothetical protein
MVKQSGQPGQSLKTTRVVTENGKVIHKNVWTNVWEMYPEETAAGTATTRSTTTTTKPPTATTTAAPPTTSTTSTTATTSRPRRHRAAAVMREGTLASRERDADVRAPARSAAVLALLAMVAAFMVLGCGSSGNTTARLGPVSGTDTMGTMGLTTSTGTGTASVHGRITYNGAVPAGSVLVALKDVAGNDVAETYAQSEFAIVGLTLGSYLLAVYTLQTGYIAQWYGGLPVQTHAAADSQILAGC